MGRIQKYLNIEEVPLDCLVSQNNDFNNQFAIQVKNTNFSWGIKFEKEDEKDKQKAKKSKK